MTTERHVLRLHDTTMDRGEKQAEVEVEQQQAGGGGKAKQSGQEVAQHDEQN